MSKRKRARLSVLNPIQLFYWNLFILFLNMAIVIYLPYKYFFFFSFPGVTQSEIIIASFILAVAVVEILVKLHTRSDMLGSDMESREIIKKNYVGLELALDLLSVVAVISIFLPETEYPILRLLIYCKLPSIIKYDRHISITIKSQIFDFIYICIKVLFLYLVYCNFTAGAFFKIDYSYYLQEGEYYHDHMLWLKDSNSMKDIINWSAPVHYIYSIFWSIITASCTGYGDLTPLNPPEVLLTILVFTPNVLLFGFMIDNINFKFDQLKEKTRAITQSQVVLLRLLRDAGVKKETFYEFKYHIGKMVVRQINEERSVTDYLTKSLGVEFTREVFRKPLEKMGDVSVEDTLTLFPLIYEMTSFERESIYPGLKYHYVVEGEGSIVLSGLDHCSYQEGCASVSEYHQNDTLNIYCFFRREPNKFIKYKTASYSKLYMIEKPPNTLSFRRRHYELMILQEYSKFGVECCICKIGKHPLEKCPFFSYIPQRRGMVKGEEKEGREQNRRERYRRHQRSNEIQFGLNGWRYKWFQEKYESIGK